MNILLGPSSHLQSAQLRRIQTDNSCKLNVKGSSDKHVYQIEQMSCTTHASSILIEKVDNKAFMD